MDTSFIFHPTTHHLPVPACPRSLYLSSPPTSYGSFTAWRHLGHSHYLLLFVPLSFFPAQSSVVVSIARGNRDSLPPFLILRRCFSLFLLFFVSFLSASILLSRSHPPTSLLLSLCPLSSSFFHYFASVLTECLEYFGNYSGRFRVCFFIPKRNISCSYHSPFPFRILL